MRPRLSWPVLLCLALVLGGFASSGLRGTLALPAHAAAVPAESPGACAGLMLTGAIHSCLTVTSIVCNPAGTVDPETGLMVGAARIRVSAQASGYDSGAVVLTAAATSITMRRGSETSLMQGGGATGFSVAGGVDSNQDLSDEASAATSHLKGAVGCL